ncbi:MAG TPA: DUF1549 domain-containing protein, partial [Gemmataceae bacterium]|nr:DUF1549 domain-containing protein [Gemmataceae bacterium]
MISSLLYTLLVFGAADPAPSFQTQVGPLLQSHCLKCHNPAKHRGGLDLTTRAGLLKGGQDGAVVAPGNSADSLLYAKIRDGKMPPDGPLADAEIELLRRWIDAGAPWEGAALTPPAEKGRAGLDWWSLQPMHRPAIPDVKNRNWARNPIDSFILAALEAKGMAPAPEADRRTYIRRATFDLIGLPPTPEEIDAFLKDDSPDAYEKLVDRLLARPEYGERWGRHWLDVARFAESYGYEMNTLRADAWPYRDYVIQAFNEDRSYPQFIREQLAGDMVGKGDFLTEAATGFLVGGPHDLVGSAIPEAKLQQRMDDLADMVSLTGATFLGLTVGCARCHDHKFDPITQKDFYGLQAVFAGVEHGERAMPPTDPDAHRREIESLRSDLAGLDAQIDDQEPLAGDVGSPPRRPPVQPRRNVERFRPIEARYIRFTIAATTDGTEPCIDELEAYGPDAPTENLALASRGGK